MKRAQTIELLANIRATIVSFVSIVMFVTLGVGLFLGIRGVALTLGRAAQITFDEGEFHDFDVSFPYGLSDDDIAAMREIEGVDVVEPCYLSYQDLDIEGERHTLTVHSLTSETDLCAMVDGDLPGKAGEIVVSQGFADEYGLAVGSKLSLVPDATDESDADGMTYLTARSYTVTGIATNPYYLAQGNLQLGMTASGKTVEGFAYVTEDAFDRSAFRDSYPRALIRAESLDALDTFSDEYRDASNALKDAIVEVGEPRAQERYDTLKAAAQAEIDRAQEKVDEGETKLTEATEQIAEGETALVTGRQQIDDAIAQLESGQKSYESAKAQSEQMLATMRDNLDKLQSSYDDALETLNQRRAEFEDLSSQIETFANVQNQYIPSILGYLDQLESINAQHVSNVISDDEFSQQSGDVASATNTLIGELMGAVSTGAPLVAQEYSGVYDVDSVAAGDSSNIATVRSQLAEYSTYLSLMQTKVDQAKAGFDSAQAQFDSLETQLQDGWAQYNQAEAEVEESLQKSLTELEEGREAIEKGEEELAQKTTELEEGKQTVAEKTVELEEGKQQLEHFKEQVDSMAFISWIVTGRSTASGSIALTNVIDLTNNLRVVMASLFLVVGLLVCYSAISRIVHEQVTQIGTKKALGFRAGEITTGYLAYTAVATVLGILLGILVSAFVVQAILYAKLAGSFDMPRQGPSFNLPDTAFIAALELALLLACAWLACRSVLRRNAIDLLLGEQRANGTVRFYERWALWKRLPLLTQTVVNNCMSDSRRVFATLVGVAGCTALIVTASTLDGNITRSLNEHFGYVYDYDVMVGFDNQQDGAQRRVAKALKENGCAYTAVCSVNYLLEAEDPAFESIIVPQDAEAFGKLFHMNVVPTKGMAPVEGVWLSQSHADHRGLKVGDTVTICTATGERYSLAIAGFFTYYLPKNMIVMSPDYYARVIGEPATPNAFIAREGKGSVDALRKTLAGTKGFVSFVDERESVEGIVRMFKGVTGTVVGIYLALSALMAVMVLLNLDYMFIDEKKRELIVLMINGFSVHDAKGYIYRDAIVMTILGIVCGVGLGIVMGSATVGAVEWQSCSFMKSVYLPGCLLGAGLSAFFAMAMMLVALRRIPRFSLIDINRI